MLNKIGIDVIEVFKMIYQKILTEGIKLIKIVK